jgi:hypothetical protein
MLRAKRVNNRSFKIIGFILMIGLMIWLNAQQENAKNKAGKKSSTDFVASIDHSGITPGIATIPAKTEGSLPLSLISKPNSNFLSVINTCQHYLHSVKFNLLQKSFLSISPKIHLNFITEYLATIRNKDYR